MATKTTQDKYIEQRINSWKIDIEALMREISAARNSQNIKGAQNEGHFKLRSQTVQNFLQKAYDALEKY